MNRNPFGVWTHARTAKWMLIALVVVGLFGQPFLSHLKPSKLEILDFYQEWSSARSLMTGRSIYAPLEETIGPYLGLVREPGTGWYWSINVHPPTSVLLAVPLQSIDYWNAFLAWNLTSLAALGLSLWLVFRELDVRFSVRCVLPLLTGLLLCEPLWQQTIQGQLNLVLLLILTGVWVADRHERPVIAGTLLGLAMVIKLFPGFLFAYFLFQRRWRALIAGTASVFGFTLLTVGLTGSDAYVTYWHEVFPTTGQWWSAWNNASLAGFWFKLFAVEQYGRSLTPLIGNTAIAQVGTAISWSVVLAMLLPIIWRARSRQELDHAFGLTLTAMLLISPVTWEHYFLLLLLPLTLVWMSRSDSGPSRWLFRCIVAALGLPLIMIGNIVIPGGFFGGTAGSIHTLTLLSLQTYGLTALYALHISLTRPAIFAATQPAPQTGHATASVST
ncbi:MAG: glycosyltransferase family 87 protein [Planctomycetota bacterium]|nr:glycosyltransferase family 87 protein [Planctomycetota bacterium]